MFENKYSGNVTSIINFASVILNERKSALPIIDRMNAGEEQAPLTKDDLREILDYAVKAKYVSRYTY